MYYFIDVSALSPEFKEDLLLRLSERYPCYHTTRFLDKDWWVFGAERLLYSSCGPDTNDTHLTWDVIEQQLAINELDGITETSMYSMFVDVEEVEF